MNEKTLLLGNGFSMAMYEGIPSWGKLISDSQSDEDANYPVLYEIELNKSKMIEKDFKEQLAKKVDVLNLKREVEGLPSVSDFGELLWKKGINNIITTNYDNGISNVLLNKCRYERGASDSTESKYSIHRYDEYYSGSTNHHIKIWKMHGDIMSPETMQLGLNQYGGYLSQIKEYVNGKYKFKENNKVVKYASLESRLKDKEPLVVNSWIDLFFSTDLYIAGFGMPFSEIDLWWLMTKRMRIMRNCEYVVNNSITYIFSEGSGETMKASLESSLKNLGVSPIKIPRTNDFIGDTIGIIR